MGALLQGHPGQVSHVKVTPKTDFASAGKSGHQYEMLNTKDPSQSRAIYVQEDRQVFEVERDADKKFTILGVKL